jgi:hypothetical protein
MLVQQQRILGQAKTAADQESKRAQQDMNARLAGAESSLAGWLLYLS